MTRGLRVGIDASNLIGGGGTTHLVEVLRAATPEAHGISHVIVWGPSATLDLLDDRPWLERIAPAGLDGNLLQRVWWQMRELDRLAEAEVDLLFAPGGRYNGSFRPFVTMSRSLLPFDSQASRWYGLRAMRAKVAILRRVQAASFRSADGVIFLTDTARRLIEAQIGELPGATAVIPHGVSPRFTQLPRPQRPLSNYSAEQPYRWLYVSQIDVYKHQTTVAMAAIRLHHEGFPIVLDLVGPAYRPALTRLRRVLRRLDPAARVVRYHGPLPYDRLHELYARTDAFVFASSCENMPNILVEAMAAGLPIACSDRSVMPEVMGGAGVLCDPTDTNSVSAAMQSLMLDPDLRTRCAQSAFDRGSKYDWRRCADQTFAFLASSARTRRSVPPALAST